MSNDGVDVRMSDGRLFHARGPATANARSPMVERRVEVTTRSADLKKIYQTIFGDSFIGFARENGIIIIIHTFIMRTSSVMVLNQRR